MASAAVAAPQGILAQVDAPVETNVSDVSAKKEIKTTQGTAQFFAGTTDGEEAFVDFDPKAERQHNFKPMDKTMITVEDLRTHSPLPNILENGREFVYAPTSLKEEDLNGDFESVKAAIESKYFPECAELVKSRTGAAKTVPFHFRHRRMTKEKNAGDAEAPHEKPSLNFHIDNDINTAMGHLTKHVPADEVPEWLGKRWQIINVWRPIGVPAYNLPLVLVDPANVDYERDTATIHTRNNYKPNLVAFKHRPDFRYYYVKNLTPDEALLFRDHDSAANAHISGTPHGAMNDLNTPEDAPLRRSVEVRVLTLYDD